MKKISIIIIALIGFSVCGSRNLMASENDSLKSWLELNGFENIQTGNLHDTLLISFENRIFRYEAEAIAYLLNEMPPSDVPAIVLLPKYQNTPMLSIMIDNASFQQYREGNIGLAAFIERMKFYLKTDYFDLALDKNKTINPSLFKVDITIEPKLSMQLGNFDRPIQLLAELGPNVNMHLAKGLSFNAQFLIPLYNNLKSMEGVSFRTGIMTISQYLRLPDDFFITATVGTFSYNRLGVDFKTKKYFLNGQLAIYTQMGYSSWTEISDTYESRYYDRDHYFIGRLGVEYRYAKYDVLASVSYGTFLYQDKGWRFDLLRQIGETIIGFRGILNTDTYNAGFYVSIPLMPRKYSIINKLRVRPSQYFSWGYNFRGQTYAGKIYSTGNNMINRSREFNPYFIRNQLKLIMQEIIIN